MKGYKHLTADQRAAVRTEYAACLDVLEVCRRTGATPDQVRHLLKKDGIPPSRAKGGACYRNLDHVRAWAAEGVAVSEIARRVGTTSSKVSAFLKKHSIPRIPFRQAGENNPSWRGGRVIDKDGYVLVKSPDHPRRDRHGYVREHRLVMEARLGRLLTETEVVHHRDGGKQNNSPDNLEVFDTNGRHLAATLTGVPKNVTPEGRAILRATAIRNNTRRRTATRPGSAPGGRASRDTTARTPS
jgi:DNA-binding transcriptional MerR regulator